MRCGAVVISDREIVDCVTRWFMFAQQTRLDDGDMGVKADRFVAAQDALDALYQLMERRQTDLWGRIAESAIAAEGEDS